MSFRADTERTPSSLDYAHLQQVPGKNLFPIDEAIERGTIIMNLLSDAAQSQTWDHIAPQITKGKTLYFSHGFSVVYKDDTHVVPPKDVDVILVAPKGSGRTVRTLFKEGRGINVSNCLRVYLCSESATHMLLTSLHRPLSLSGKMLPARPRKRLSLYPWLSDAVTHTRPHSRRRSTPTFTVKEDASWVVSVSRMSYSIECLYQFLTNSYSSVHRGNVLGSISGSTRERTHPIRGFQRDC